MKKFLYSLLLLFTFYTVSAQTSGSPGSTPRAEAIDKKLKEIAQNLNSDPKIHEKELLQLKTESEKSGYDQGILYSGSLLIRLYETQGRNEEVIHLGKQLKKVAKNKKDLIGTITNIYRRNATVLGYLGLDDESMKDFRTAIRYAKDIENGDTKAYYLSLCYENMTGYYIKKQFDNKKYRDTIVSYLNKSLDAIKQVKDNNGTVSNDLKYDQMAFIDMRIGMHLLEQTAIKGSIEQAEKHLLEGLKIHKNKEYHNIPSGNKIMMLNQVSWLYLEKKEYQKSIDYAKQALELENQFKSPSDRVESYEFLSSSYLELGEKEKSKLYMDKYTFLKDSLNIAEKNQANVAMKKMVAEADSRHQQSSKKQLFIYGILCLAAATVILLLWKRKDKIYRRKYEELISRIQNKKQISENTENTTTRSSVTIMDETVKSLLQNLEKFEKSEGYLKKEVSLTWLAHHLNTNTKYLSEIIKTYRDKNFADYINELRIDYIVDKLYNEPKYRLYKISSLAEECGFASPRVFLTAFKKINEVTPSYFIRELENREMVS